MAASAQTAWEAVSDQLASVAENAGKYAVSVHGGHRIGASGILWERDLIVTTSHTLRHANALTVKFADKSSVQTELLGRDVGTDIAVLRANKADLDAFQSAFKGNFVPFEKPINADKLRVGQLVLSIGRSRMDDLSASAGIIARLGSAWQTWRGGQIDYLLRPDLTLYPGLSGSALVDSRGRLLGMNTSALARAATITIPRATIERVVKEIVEHGGVFRPYLGLAMQPVALPDELAQKLGRKDKAALMVMQVEPGSPSAKAGIILGDLILSIDAQPVTGIEQVQHALGKAKRGDSVELGYSRGGQTAAAKVKLADRPPR